MQRLKQMDGLKAWAILVIIASHTVAFGMRGQGSIWADFFFVLAGFFCVKPTITDGESSVCSIKGIVKFYFLKFVRVVPLYWGCLLFFCWLNGTISNKRYIVKSMLFYQTEGHNWYLQHLVVGYLCAPIVLVAVYFLKSKLKFNNLCIGLILTCVGMGLSYWLLYKSKLYLLWNGGNHRVIFSGLVIIGMGIGYIYKAINSVVLKKYVYYIIDVVEVALIMILTVFTSNPFLVKIDSKYEGYIWGWHHPFASGVISAVLILVASFNKEGIITRLLCWKILTVLGEISLGVYLVHYYLLQYFVMSPVHNFAIILLCSVAIAYCSYQLVEKKMYDKVKTILVHWGRG